ncbi:MAG: hypothetical protein K1Y36_05495 [Blastocatellia bacterium]|nr:hypothetical protein [Blastocatellia bacterium]
MVRASLCGGLLLVLSWFVFFAAHSTTVPPVQAKAQFQTAAGWKVTPDTNFAVSGQTPNAGWVDNQVWLIVGTNQGPRLFRSADGTNQTQGETFTGLGAEFEGTNFVPTEMVPREAKDGTNEIYVLGLGKPGTNSGVVFRMRDTGQGKFVRSPKESVFQGGPADKSFIGVPDVFQRTDGNLGMVYVALGGAHNANLAVSTDQGATFQFEYDNPFKDKGIPLTAETNNVDPTILKLAQGGFLAVTMRATRLYLFTSQDGRDFTPVNLTPLEGSLFGSTNLGFFDPTLVQTADGRILMYATLGDFRAPGNEKVVRFVITPPTDTNAAPQATLISPNGGEKLVNTAPLSIKWAARDDVGIASQQLDLSTDGGNSFSLPLASGLAGAVTDFQAILPTGLVTTRARVKVTVQDASGLTGFDSSDQDFSIQSPATDTTAPVVRVLAPNGGETLKAGGSFRIVWQSTDETALGSQEIRLSADGGATFTTLVATGLLADTKEFVFVVPANQPKTKAGKIRVIATDKAGNQGQDDSDAVFRVKKSK